MSTTATEKVVSDDGKFQIVQVFARSPLLSFVRDRLQADFRNFSINAATQGWGWIVQDAGSVARDPRLQEPLCVVLLKGGKPVACGCLIAHLLRGMTSKKPIPEAVTDRCPWLVVSVVPKYDGGDFENRVALSLLAQASSLGFDEVSIVASPTLQGVPPEKKFGVAAKLVWQSFYHFQLDQVPPIIMSIRIRRTEKG